MGVVGWHGDAFELRGLSDLPTDGTMNFGLYQKQDVQPSVCDLKLKCNWVMQQENDLKHKSK